MKKVCEGIITSKFGYRTHPITLKKTFHNGIDIGCPIGTAVCSPVEAVVMQVYTHTTGGKTVILRDFITNERFGFCHLSEIKVEQGKRIPKGFVFALSGNTGLGTGAHLHFSYAIKGYWKDNICYGFIFQDPTPKIEIK